MKTTLFTITTISLADTAAVQSNATLYDSIDEGVVYINSLKSGAPSDSALRMDLGTIQPDHFGLRGSENFGGGTQVILQLESEFLGNTGNNVAAGKLFNHVAWMGLTNDRLDDIQPGHQVDFMFDYFGRLNSGFQLTNFYLFHPGNFDNLASQFQIDSAVRCVSPIFGGLQLGDIYGFDEVPGSSSKNRSYSLGAHCINGGFYTATACTTSNNRALDVARHLGIINTLGTILVPGVMAPVGSVKSSGAGTLYQFSGLPLRINVVYAQTCVTPGGADARAQNVDLGIAWHYGATNTLDADYTFSRYESARQNQFSLGNTYTFFKHTQMYVQGTYQRMSGDVWSAAINGVGMATQCNQLAVSIGVYYLF